MHSLAVWILHWRIKPQLTPSVLAAFHVVLKSNLVTTSLGLWESTWRKGLCPPQVPSLSALTTILNGKWLHSGSAIPTLTQDWERWKPAVLGWGKVWFCVRKSYLVHFSYLSFKVLRNQFWKYLVVYGVCLPEFAILRLFKSDCILQLNAAGDFSNRGRWRIMTVYSRTVYIP